MIYGIIAAGEGSRLASEGYLGLKPMVYLNGEMMIDRLINVFIENEAEAIYIIINENSEKLKEHLQSLNLKIPLEIITKSTVSSLHSLNELLLSIPDVAEICLTTADTIFDKKEFKEYINQFTADKNNDGLLAVTSFIDDESPLYVTVDNDSRILEVIDQTNIDQPFVSGGIYCLRRKALELVPVAIEQGLHRMRNFQRLLTENQLLLTAYNFKKIMDVDHVSDITKAEIFLKEIESQLPND